MNLRLKSQLQKVIQAFQGESFDEARLILDEVLKHDINSADNVFELGIAYVKANRLVEASTIFCTMQSYKNDDVRIPYNLGLIYSIQGNHPQALQSYDLALEIQPDDIDAIINKSSVFNEIKNYTLALAAIEVAIKIRPDVPEAWSNKGIALNNLNLLEESINSYNEAIKLNPNYHEAWSNKSIPLNKLNRFAEALEVCDQSLSLKPDYAQAWSNKGNVLYELKRYDEALAHHDKALSLKPDYAEAWSNKGNTLNELKRYDEALAHYDKALSLKPDYAEAWSNKGNVLYELKRYDEALAHYDKALSLKPDYAQAWSNKGVTCNELKRYDEALAHYDKALSLKPDYAEAWSNKGNVLYELKRYDEALAHYDKALSLKPDYAEAWSNKGNTLNELKRYDEALAHYDKALSLKPDLDWVFGDLLHTKMKICSWSGLAESLQVISKKVLANEKVSQPFVLLSLSDNPLLHKKCSEIYSQSKYPSNKTLGSFVKKSKKEKIRIGYYSSEFRHHAVSILSAELFELHDRNIFEIIGFSLGVNDNSSMRLRLNQAIDQLIDVGHMSDLEIAIFSRKIGIDIAVDLGGFTSDNRAGIFSYRAAPIQISYLGYLGTMGVKYFDYILADQSIISDHSEHCFSEKIVYLPSYQVNDRKRVISDRVFTKQELGLPEKGVIFCCFNNNYKILPSIFEGWMCILKAVEDSVLFLFAENELSKANLIREAISRGIDSTRLVFGGRIPADEYLARYRVCDLFLDTAPYNAGTTASDALWAGVPVLTLMGQSFASRVAASLLNAVGLPELITDNQEDYEALAIELALNPQKLSDLKLKLNKNRFTTALFNTPLFTKNLETAYIKMMERYEAGLQPDHMHIDPVVPQD